MIETSLKESFKCEGCPVCRTIKEEFSSFMWWFEREGYHEISSINSLEKSSFICRKHADMLKSLRDKLNNTFELLIKHDSETLLLLKEINKRKVKKIIGGDFKCRFCEEETRIEELAIHTLAKHENLQRTYLSSTSLLCKKHLFMLLSKIENKYIYDKIIDKTLDFLHIRSKNIEEFFKKMDYKSPEKPSTEKREYIHLLRFYTSDY